MNLYRQLPRGLRVVLQFLAGSVMAYYGYANPQPLGLSVTVMLLGIFLVIGTMLGLRQSPTIVEHGDPHAHSTPAAATEAGEPDNQNTH